MKKRRDNKKEKVNQRRKARSYGTLPHLELEQRGREKGLGRGNRRDGEESLLQTKKKII